MKKFISVVFGLLTMVSFCFADRPAIMDRSNPNMVVYEGSMKLYDSAIPDGDYFVKINWDCEHDRIVIYIKCMEKDLADSRIDCGSVTSSPLLPYLSKLAFSATSAYGDDWKCLAKISINNGCLTKIWTDDASWDEYDRFWSKALFGDRAGGQGLVKWGW